MHTDNFCSLQEVKKPLHLISSFSSLSFSSFLISSAAPFLEATQSKARLLLFHSGGRRGLDKVPAAMIKWQGLLCFLDLLRICGNYIFVYCLGLGVASANISFKEARSSEIKMCYNAV